MIENNDVNDKVLIAFYKGDILNDFKRESDGKRIAVIQFPKSSKYSGYVWYWPLEWINSNDNSKNDKASSFNPDKRWIIAKAEYDFRCIKNELNKETKKWETISEVILKPADIKEAMKRPMKKSED